MKRDQPPAPHRRPNAPKSGAKKNPGATKPPGQRQLRVAERIRHLLADVMLQGNFYDPDLAQSSMISVTAVDIGPDLQHANAYIMPLGGKDKDKVLAALNRASGYFRSAIAPKMDLRYTPKISFRIDNSFEESDRINRLLNQEQVRKDLDKSDDGDDQDREED